MSGIVAIEIEQGIAVIKMDDGKVNAMSVGMMNAINRALDQAETAGTVVMLQGREGIFSAGFDMKTFAEGPEKSLEMIRTGADLILRFLNFPLPILTVCTGHAYPMGAFLMLSADSRIGVPGPWKIGMNEVAIAMTIPKFAIELARHRLTPPALLGANTGYLFSPQEAAIAGYLDRVVEAHELETTARAEAERLRTLDMLSFKATKARVNAPAIDAIRTAIHSEFGEITASENAQN